LDETEAGHGVVVGFNVTSVEYSVSTTKELLGY
jgi:hypothetical protein